MQPTVAAHWQREQIISNVGKSEKPYLWASKWTTGPVPVIYPATRVWLFGAWKTAGASMPPHWLVGLGCMMAAKNDSELLRPRDADGAMEKTSFIPNASVKICTEFGDPMASVVPGRVRMTNSRSVACFGLARPWMKVCKDQHDCVPKGSVLPKSVLAITGTRERMSVHLLETEGQPGDYVALSHSWGKGRPLVTTTRNIEDFRREIPFDDLPRTFRDAVSITNELRFCYLWIDSLCIIQNSPDDWAEQSMCMAAIYAGSNITIFAAGSSSDEEGIFLTRSEIYNPPDNDTGLGDARPPAIATAAVKLSSGQTSQLTFFPQRINDGGLGTLTFPLDPITQDPLSSRAWAFQERILWPRKLMYGHDQMVGLCIRRCQMIRHC